MADEVRCDGPSAQDGPIPAGIDTEVMERNEDSARLESLIPAGIDAIELALVGHDLDSDLIIPAGIDTEVMERNEDFAELESVNPAGIDAIELALVGHDFDSDPIIPAGTDTEVIGMEEDPTQQEQVIPAGSHPIEFMVNENSSRDTPTDEENVTPPESENIQVESENVIPAGSHSAELITDEKIDPIIPAVTMDEIPTESTNVESEEVIPAGSHPAQLITDEKIDLIIPAVENDEIPAESTNVESEEINPAGSIPAESTTDETSILTIPAVETDVIPAEPTNVENEEVNPAGSHSAELITDEKIDPIIPAVTMDEIPTESTNVESEEVNPAGSHPVELSADEKNVPLIPAAEKDGTRPESDNADVESEQFVPAGSHPFEAVTDDIPAAENGAIPAELYTIEGENEEVIHGGSHPVESVMDAQSDSIIPAAEEDTLPPELETFEVESEQLTPIESHPSATVMDAKSDFIIPVEEEAANPPELNGVFTSSTSQSIELDGNPAGCDIDTPAGMKLHVEEGTEVVGLIPDSSVSHADSESIIPTGNSNSGKNNPGGITTGDLTEEQFSAIDMANAENSRTLPAGMKLPKTINDVKIDKNIELDRAPPSGSEDPSEQILPAGLITDHLKLEVENLSQQVLHYISDKETPANSCNPAPGIHPKLSRTYDVEKKVQGPATLPEVAIYRRRWLMLTIFCLVSALNGFHWIQYSIISDVIQRFYNVTSRQVDWTSLIFMGVYPILFFPVSWIMQKIGLRYTVITGSVLTSIGVWVKLFANDPSRYYVVIIGQIVVAMGNVFILSIPPNVAAVWFGPQQVSSACSIGVFGNQLGIALGFLLPPMLIKSHEILDDTVADLNTFFYCLGGITTAMSLITIIAFREKPPLPPTLARSAVLESPTSYLPSIKRLFKNPNFLNLTVTYGINAGVYYSMSTLLQQIVIDHFPGEGESAGRIGLTLIVAGMVGSVIGGFILDKTQSFKGTTVAVYFLSVVSMAAYTVTYDYGHQLYITFITAGLVGFFMTGYLPVGFEFAAELTYPESEMISSGLLNVSAQIIGVLLTLLGGWLLNSYGDIVCNSVLSAILLGGAVLTSFIKSDLRRQGAFNAGLVPV